MSNKFSQHRSAEDPFGPRSLAELAEADQVIAALAEAFPPGPERRKSPRLRYQVRARLEMIDDDAAATLHTRDVNTNAGGFVTRRPLAVQDQGILRVDSPDGTERRIPCRVKRSDEVGDGWFEGMVEFEAEQPVFCKQKIRG